MNKTGKSETFSLILAALFAAVIAVCAQIQIPTPFFTITLQTFAVALCGYTLGVKYSLFSVLAYILLGIVGAPVFSGFCGGIHDILEPQGGFILAFPVLALFCGFSYRLKKDFHKILSGFAGVTVMYAFGIFYFVFMTTANKSIGVILLLFSGAYFKDLFSCVASFYIARIIRKRVIKQ